MAHRRWCLWLQGPGGRLPLPPTRIITGSPCSLLPSFPFSSSSSIFNFARLRGKEVNLLFYLTIFHFSFGEMLYILYPFFLLRYLGIFLVNLRKFLFIKDVNPSVLHICCRYFSQVEANFLQVRNSGRGVRHESSYGDMR